jgi:glycosyltransferase involved in cell wall biosynthesis
MRVCLIAPVPPFRGGIAKYCYSLAKELEKRHDLLLLSYRRQYPELLYGKKSQTDPEIDRARIASEFTRLSYEIDSVNVFSWMATLQKIAAFKAELVIFPWWVAYWTPMYLFLQYSLQRKGIKVTFLCINVFEHEDNWLKKLLTKATLGTVDSIVVHSDQEKQTALEINPKAQVVKHLLPLFHYEAASSAGDHRTLRLLFFGFVRQYKGLDLLLRAVGMLKDRDITLTIAGEFWGDKQHYLELIEAQEISDKVEIIDRYVSDREMSLIFAEADLVVLPYRKTLTSGVIATAYGFAKPVLATDVGGFREVVRDGLTGKIVARDSARAIAEGIVWFIDHRQTDFAANIAAFAAQEMSWSSLVDAIEGIGGVKRH